MDYSFFDENLQARFTDYLDATAISWSVSDDPMGGTTVYIADEVAEQLPEDVQDAVETFYDELLDEQSSLAEERPGWINKRMAGIHVTLADGKERTVALDATLSNRLLEAFSADEVAELVRAIATSLSQDFNGPLCKYPEELKDPVQ